HTPPITLLTIVNDPTPTHRDLHPFPTRRSSDLGETREVRGAVAHLETAAVARLCHGAPRRRRHAGPRLSRIGSALPATAPGHSADRKSTRLNSSHVSISYAVFCLKKKNGTSYAM